jgi:hypothetical protein
MPYLFMCVDNCIELFIFANLHAEDNVQWQLLLKKCKLFIKDHTKEVFETEELSRVELSTLVEVLCFIGAINFI